MQEVVMDDISNAVISAKQAGKDVVGRLDSFLSTLDKHHLLPMREFRKKNMRDKQTVELELEEQRHVFTLKREEAEAKARARIALIEAAPALALETSKRQRQKGGHTPRP